MSGFGSRARRVCVRLWAPGAASAVVAVLVVSAPAAAATPPSRHDVRSARRFIADLTGFYQAGLDTRRQATADVNASIELVKGMCPKVVPAAAANGTKRQQMVATKMFAEAAYDIGLVATFPIDAAALREAAGLERLHFSTRRADRDARQIAVGQRLTVAIRPSDLCGDLTAAAADDYRRVPTGTTRFLAAVTRAFAAPSPSFADLDRDIGPYLTTSRDRAAVKRVHTLAKDYLAFEFDLGLRAAVKLAGVLTGTKVEVGGQAGTTAAASTRSTSSSNEMPAASAASGSRLVSVSPGIGLTSSTYSSPVAVSSMRSTRAKPAHPRSP